MRGLVKTARFMVSQDKIPLALSYPFQYTLSPQEYNIPDVRFTELPFSKQLAKPQKEHIHHHLLNFQNLINQGKRASHLEEYMHKSLIDKVMEMRKVLQESGIQLQFQLDTQSITKTIGYLQIKPQEGVSLEEKALKPIHFYRFQRERETLTVSLKPQKETLTAQEQLKKDLKDKMGEQTKDMREKLQNLKLSKHAIFVNRFINKLMSIGKPQPKKKFEPYFIIDQLQGTMSCKMTHSGHLYSQTQIPFDSKWMYWVSNLESQDLKRHRKRTLFDFQYWNRGNFFPVKNYAAQAQQYQL